MLKARVQLIFGALLFSTGGVAIKAATLTGWQVSCLRSLLGGLVILVLIPRARQGWTWRSLVVAVPFAATFTFFTLSNKLTTAANAMFLQETAPFYVLLLGPLLLGERIVKRDLAFMAALVAGLVLILGSGAEPLDTAPKSAIGEPARCVHRHLMG
ncbi:MAG: EamA family transporter, partial [Rhodospirillaceae bacterium]|nr:EamA family transporter [Rhodospirillaceae bacterium]